MISSSHTVFRVNLIGNLSLVHSRLARLTNVHKVRARDVFWLPTQYAPYLASLSKAVTNRRLVRLPEHTFVNLTKFEGGSLQHKNFCKFKVSALPSKAKLALVNNGNLVPITDQSLSISKPVFCRSQIRTVTNPRLVRRRLVTVQQKVLLKQNLWPLAKIPYVQLEPKSIRIITPFLQIQSHKQSVTQSLTTTSVCTEPDTLMTKSSLSNLSKPCDRQKGVTCFRFIRSLRGFVERKSTGFLKCTGVDGSILRAQGEKNARFGLIGQPPRHLRFINCYSRVGTAFLVKSYKDGVDLPPDNSFNTEIARRPLLSNEPELDSKVPKRSDEQETRTIVITSGKGGVGKTTTTANLGMSIARLGYRVALIDADIGLRNLDLLLGLENRVLYTAMDIFEGDCRLDQALIRDKRLKNLCLLAISKNRQRYNVTRQKMDTLIASISALGYHFILIDCPAGIDIGFINAISPAQEALIVTTPEITAMRDADRVAGLLEANGIYNAKLLINRVRPDMIQRHDMMSVQDVQDVLGIPLLGAIPEDLNVIISTNRGEPLVLRKKLTLSGIAFENAARRLIGRSDYLIDLKTPYKGLFQKMKTLFFNN
jgi:septum site-determining protein MinD